MKVYLKAMIEEELKDSKVLCDSAEGILEKSEYVFSTFDPKHKFTKHPDSESQVTEVKIQHSSSKCLEVKVIYVGKSCKRTQIVISTRSTNSFVGMGPYLKPVIQDDQKHQTRNILVPKVFGNQIKKKDE